MNKKKKNPLTKEQLEHIDKMISQFVLGEWNLTKIRDSNKNGD